MVTIFQIRDGLESHISPHFLIIENIVKKKRSFLLLSFNLFRQFYALFGLKSTAECFYGMVVRNVEKDTGELMRESALAGVGDRAKAHGLNNLPAEVGVLHSGFLIWGVLTCLLNVVDRLEAEGKEAENNATTDCAIGTHGSVKVIGASYNGRCNLSADETVKVGISHGEEALVIASVKLDVMIVLTNVLTRCNSQACRCNGSVGIGAAFEGVFAILKTPCSTNEAAKIVESNVHINSLLLPLPEGKPSQSHEAHEGA